MEKPGIDMRNTINCRSGVYGTFKFSTGSVVGYKDLKGVKTSAQRTV